jgi:type I restriction enzyme S subunit
MQTTAVLYKQLIRWDVKSFLLPTWSWDESELFPLGSVLKRKQIEYKAAESPSLLSLHFDGEFSKRNVTSLKGKIFAATPGDLVYSKIDVRNGAIGIVHDDFTNAAFTTEFPIYEVDTKKISPLFLKLILKTKLFNQLINSLVSGSSGRKRVNPADLEKLSVPVPPLSIQMKFVNEWQKAFNEAENLKIKARGDDNKAIEYLLSKLGVEKVKIEDRKGSFVINFKDLDRWDFQYVLKQNDGLENTNFALQKLEDITTDIFQGVSKDYVTTSSYYLLKVKNIMVDGTIDFTNIEPVRNCPERKLLKRGDIVSPFIGEAVRLNKFSIFNGEENRFTVDNNTGVIRVNRDVVLPEYVRICLASPLVKNQINSIIIGGSVPFLGKTNAQKLRIPVPSIKEQSEIVEKVTELQHSSKAMHEKAELIIRASKQRMENLLTETNHEFI